MSRSRPILTGAMTALLLSAAPIAQAQVSSPPPADWMKAVTPPPAKMSAAPDVSALSPVVATALNGPVVTPPSPTVSAANPSDDIASGVPASESGPPLQTLEDVLRWADRNNPDLRSARAAYRAVEEDLPAAEAGYKPTVSADGTLTETRLHADGSVSGFDFGGSGINFTATGLAKETDGKVTEPLYRGGQTVASIKSARSAIAGQRALLISHEQQILLQTATAYMNLVRDIALLQVNDDNIRDINEQLIAAQDQFNAGQTTRTDVAQAQAALSDAQAKREAAAGNVRTSRAVFEQLVGFPPGTLGQPQLHFPIPGTLGEAASFADAHNPDIEAAKDLHETSQADIDRIKGQLLPEVDALGELEFEADPDPGVNIDLNSAAIGVQAHWNLYTGGATQSQIRQARATANQHFIDIVTSQRSVRQQVVSAWENLAAIRAELKSRAAQVDAAGLAAEGTQQQARAGSRTLLDALDSQQIFLNAKVAQLQAIRDETVAIFTLASTLGMLTPEVLGFAAVPPDDTTEFQSATPPPVGTPRDEKKTGFDKLGAIINNYK